MKNILLVLAVFCFISFQGNAQEVKLTKSSVSDCQQNCSIKSSVVSQSLLNQKLRLKIGTNSSCAVNDRTSISIEAFNDTLNILVQNRPDTIWHYRNDTASSYSITNSIAMCNCFFYVDLVIENVKNVPNVILVNGWSFDENHKTRTIIELTDTSSFKYEIRTLTGVALNAKEGAVIVTEKGGYVLDNKSSWSKRILDRKITAKVKVVRVIENTASDLGYDTGVYTQGSLGKTVYVKIISKKFLPDEE